MLWNFLSTILAQTSRFTPPQRGLGNYFEGDPYGPPVSGVSQPNVSGVAPGGSGGVVDFQSPLGYQSFDDLIINIINGLIILATPIVIIMVLYASFLYITSAGNPAKIKKGTDTLIWTAVGYGILLIAKGVSFIIRQLLGGF